MINMKKLIKICSNCLIVLCAFCLLLLLFINFSSNKGEFIKIGKYSFLDVNGDSMYPKIKDGDYIAINMNVKEKYEKGDIVSFVYSSPDGKFIVTHEIVEVINNEETYMYVTKGINNDENDENTLTNSEIIGKYMNFRIPLLGYVVRFSRTQLGYFLLVVVPLGLMLLISTYELIKELSKKKGED